MLLNFCCENSKIIPPPTAEDIIDIDSKNNCALLSSQDLKYYPNLESLRLNYKDTIHVKMNENLFRGTFNRQ